jgi:hypothetical protein
MKGKKEGEREGEWERESACVREWKGVSEKRCELEKKSVCLKEKEKYVVKVYERGDACGKNWE